MSGTIVSFILGFLLSTSFACLFHLLVGGAANRILLYIVMANIGFFAGHFFGQGMDVGLMKLGPVYLFTATLGAIGSLIFAKWLWPTFPPPDGEQQ